MGKNSEYNRKLREKTLAKLHDLERNLPRYAVVYLDDRELSCQPNTALGYAYDIRTFFNYLKENNPLCKNYEIKNIPESILEQLSFEDINEYQKYLACNTTGTKHLNSESGIARRMAALRGMFQYCCLHGYFRNNPVLGASKRTKVKTHEIVRMNAQEVNRLVTSVQTTNLVSPKQRKFCQKTQLRDTAIITLLLNTGIRVSECVGLDMGDINFNDKSMGIVRKGGNTQRIYFSDEVANALHNYIDNERNTCYDESIETKAVFLSSQKRRMCVKSVENVVRKYALEAVPDKHITVHKCRSTYGSALYQETGDIYLVAHVLGHKDINTTQKNYSAMEEQHSRKAASVDLYNKNQK